MGRSMCVIIVTWLAITTVQANQCPGGGKCASNVDPNNIKLPLEDTQQMGVLKDGAEENRCSSGGECPSSDNSQYVASLLQTKLGVNVLEFGGEETHCSSGDECQSKENAENKVLLMQTDLAINVLELDGKETHCSSGDECQSKENVENEVLLMQTDLAINVLELDDKEASSASPHDMETIGKNRSHQFNMSVMGSPDAMLTELEDVTFSGQAPAFEIITRIKVLVLDQLLPGLTALRELTEQETTERSDEAQACNDKSKEKERDIEATVQASVEEARLQHSRCRDLEQRMFQFNLTDPDSHCVKLEAFLTDAASLTLHIPKSSNRDESVNYIEQASESNMCGRSEVRALADGCAAQEAELREKSDNCSMKQQVFEVDFCNWKTELEANCEELDTCHSTAAAGFDKHVSKTQKLTEKWNAEFATLEKILCYCNAWLSETDPGDNRSKHNGTQLEACKNQTYTPFYMDYGTLPEKVSCPLSSVSIYPGTSGFINEEYSIFSEFVQEVVPCPQTMTTAPTIASPTTDQVPTTKVSTTEAPTTEAPTTEAPTTNVPTTEAPTTEAPTTEAEWQLGAPGQSCDAVCGQRVCNVQAMRDFVNEQVTDAGRVSSMAGVTCWQARNSGHGEIVPWVWAQPRGDGTFDCASVRDEYKDAITTCGGTSPNVRRLCACEAR